MPVRFPVDFAKLIKRGAEESEPRLVSGPSLARFHRGTNRSGIAALRPSGNLHVVGSAFAGLPGVQY